jgi:membrane protein involved in colicin uptake
MTQKPYSELVAQAESAVAAVKDAELRRVAFEKILDDLLAEGGDPRDAPRRAAVAAPASKAKASAKSEKSKVSRSGPQAYVDEMVDDGFFKKPKTISDVKAELSNRGHHIPLTSLSGPLQKLCQKKRLRRHKVDGEGKKRTFGYSNW